MLTAAAVAKQLGLARRTVYTLRARGDLGGFLFGTSVRFHQSDVDAYIDRCRKCPSATTSATDAGASGSTALFKAAGTDLASYFRSVGVKPKLTNSTGKKARGSTPLQLVSDSATR